MKLALIAGLALLGITAGVTTAYFVWLRAPSPAVVCQHILDVTVAEAGESDLAPETQQALIARIKGECIAHKENKLLLRGRIEYAEYARCVVEHDTLRGIEGC